MHVLVGALAVLMAFGLAGVAQRQAEFGGLINPAAMILLGLGPLGVAMISHPFSEWLNNLRVLGRAFGHRRAETMSAASEEMSQLARAVREARWEDAERVIQDARSEQVRNLAPHLLNRYDGEALREAIAASAYRWMSDTKTADEFFQGLGRAAPAFGMIGTIMGLVDLFANMRDSSALGPGMAMALLATLYGLFLCYCVYLPLAARIRTYYSAGIGEQRLIERSLLLITDGRPIHEVRNSFLHAADSIRPSSNSEGGRT